MENLSNHNVSTFVMFRGVTHDITGPQPSQGFTASARCWFPQGNLFIDMSYGFSPQIFFLFLSNFFFQKQETHVVFLVCFHRKYFTFFDLCF